MARGLRSTRTRYPARALLALAGAAVAFLFNMVAGFLLMALVPPMIPIYICVLFSGACLLGSALKYAQRLSIRAPAAMLEAGAHEEEVEERASAARTT